MIVDILPDGTKLGAMVKVGKTKEDIGLTLAAPRVDRHLPFVLGFDVRTPTMRKRQGKMQLNIWQRQIFLRKGIYGS